MNTLDTQKLKIYDLDALLRAECSKQAFRYRKVAVFEGKKGVVVAEEEAVHQKGEDLSSTIDIEANNIARPGKAWIMPSYIVSVQISDVKEAPFTEMTMEEFFKRRDYNPRCQSNWRELLTSLDAIGFDLQKYLPERQRLDQKIRSANEQAGEKATVRPLPQEPER